MLRSRSAPKTPDGKQLMSLQGFRVLQLTVPNMGCIIPNMGETKSRKEQGSLATNLADALFPKTRQRVLAVLYGNTDRSFYANEIIRLAGSGTGGVQRELASLASAGLVTVRRVGNQTHYQANTRCPVFESVHDLVLKTSGLADVLRATLAAIAPKIRAAFVFGSVARNQAGNESDVDVLVISDHLAYAELFAALEEPARRLGRTINPTLYTTDEFARRVHSKNAFVTRLVAQPKIWLMGTEDDISA
jgi:predicted nucleotidyltransferase